MMNQISNFHRDSLTLPEKEQNKEQDCNKEDSRDQQAKDSTTNSFGAPTIDDESITRGVESKRNKKLIRKDNIESIKFFFSTLPDINFTTKIQYAQIINELLNFSSDCDLNEYFSFLKFKSGISDTNDSKEFVIEGTLIKYSHVLKRYLHHIHNKEVVPVKINYCNKPFKVPVNTIPRILTKEVFECYQKLIDKDKVEDAVLLHTIYELGLEPYRISLLMWSSLANDKTMKYFDHKLREIIVVKISNELYSDLIYLKQRKALKNIQKDYDKRYSLDGTTFIGGFIFSSKPTEIFNKFKRRFGGALKIHEIIPKDLVILSKYQDKVGNKKFCRSSWSYESIKKDFYR